MTFGVCVKEIERLTESPTSTDRDKHLEQFRELKSELEVDISEHLNSTTKPSDSRIHTKGQTMSDQTANRREFLKATGCRDGGGRDLQQRDNDHRQGEKSRVRPQTADQGQLL